MRKNRVIFHRNPLYEKCPSCGESNTMRRSRARTFTEKVINAATLHKMYRCRECGWRGAISTIAFTSLSYKSLLFYLILILISAYIVSYTLRTFF